MQPISYARHRFPPVVIRHTVWLYLRFTLSYRDVEDLLAEHGLEVSNETIRRRCHGNWRSDERLSPNSFLYKTRQTPCSGKLCVGSRGFAAALST